MTEPGLLKTKQVVALYRLAPTSSHPTVPKA